VIDSAIFLTGVDLFGKFFEADAAVKAHVDAIFARVEWTFFFDQASQQFRLSYKPAMDSGHTVAAPGGGFFSNSTMDYYTDEGILIWLLGANDAALSAAPFYKMIRQSTNGVVVTFPGAWFTYCFATTSVLPPWLGADRGSQFGLADVDWHANARLAAMAADPSGITLLLPNAGERPNGDYRAEADIAIAVDQAAADTHTLYPYSALMASALGGAITNRAVKELQNDIDRIGLLHGSFGLMDAYHDDLADFLTRPTSAFSPERPALRTTGPWVAQTQVGINEGPGLVAVLNRLGGYAITRLAVRSPRVGNGMALIWRGQPMAAAQIVPPTSGPAQINHASFTLNTTAPARDSLKFTTAFALADYSPQAGDQLSIEFGTVSRSFTLSDKLASKSATGDFLASAKSKNGQVTFSFQCKGWLTELSTLDFSQPVPVRLFVNSQKDGNGQIVYAEIPMVLAGDATIGVVEKGSVVSGQLRPALLGR
jgi:hypothetical protein